MTDKLSDRIEAASEGSRELDAEMFAALYPNKIPSPIVESGYGWRFDGQGWWRETGEDNRTPRKSVYPPPYTTSLDAAMTLVPEGWRWCHYSSPRSDVPCEARLVSYDRVVTSYAATPALALCAAALRARGL